MRTVDFATSRWAHGKAACAMLLSLLCRRQRAKYINIGRELEGRAQIVARLSLTGLGPHAASRQAGGSCKFRQCSSANMNTGGRV